MLGSFLIFLHFTQYLSNRFPGEMHLLFFLRGFFSVLVPPIEFFSTASYCIAIIKHIGNGITGEQETLEGHKAAMKFC